MADLVTGNIIGVPFASWISTVVGFNKHFLLFFFFFLFNLTGARGKAEEEVRDFSLHPELAVANN